MSNVKVLLDQKKQRVAATFRREQPDKVPFLFAADSYVPYYAGVKLTDIQSYDYAIEVVKKVVDDLQYDCVYFPYLPQNLLLTPKLNYLGGGAHVVSPDYIKQIDESAVNILTPDDYDGIIEDPFNYLIEKVFPRRFEAFRDINPDEKFQRVKGVYEVGMGVGKYFADAEEQCGVVVLPNGQYHFNPIDFMFDVLRGPDIMKDIKRKPEKVRDAGLAMVDGALKYTKYRTPCEYRALFCPMHLPPFLSPKDFEKVYWPSFKKFAEGLVEQGHNVVYYFEVSYGHLFDYLQDLPKKGITGIFEKDDIRVVKKKLGNNMAIAGGLNTNTLYFGTKSECVDMAKGLIDDIAPGGGFFLAPNTPLTFPIDAKPENLKAVAEFVLDYGKY